MPSFTDGAFIFVLALLLFGPKKLPELARQVGKLMAEFRRASNEFRIQMEDELRISEQADRQKQIAAMEAAAPVIPAFDYPEPEHPHMPSYAPEPAISHDHQIHSPALGAGEPEPFGHTVLENEAEIRAQADPLPIASSGDLDLMPPATGLPVGRSSSLSSAFASIPTGVDPDAAEVSRASHAHEASAHDEPSFHTQASSHDEASLHG